jgi:hypothetical protein
MASEDSTFDGIGVSVLPSPDADLGHQAAPRPTIAILSLGEMGLGIATLLSKYHYRILTNLDGRSDVTKARAEAAGASIVSFNEILAQASIFISIVPPSDALQLAEKVGADLLALRHREEPLVYLDLNAISPTLSRKIAEPILAAGHTYIDGSILGFPPKLISESDSSSTWFRPAIPVSGPTFPSSFSHLVTLMNIKHVSDNLGAASGLKMCFGGINKALTAVALQSYTTAASMGVLKPLRQYLGEYYPGLQKVAENSIIASQRKAYRWVREMQEVQETTKVEGGWDGDLWQGFGGVFEVVAEIRECSGTVDTRDDIESVIEVVGKALKRARRKSL